MKCENCGNEYPSSYYFATEKVCKECFSKLPTEEQITLIQNTNNVPMYSEYDWRATFGLRLGAALLDYVFFFIIFIIVLLLTGVIGDYKDLLEEMLNNPELLEEFSIAILPYMFIVTFMYYSLEIMFATTPGKAVLGLQIASENKTTASYNTLTMRFFYKHFSSILAFVGFIGSMKFLDTLGSLFSLIIVIGFFFVLAPKRQAFHDMLAKTAVFRKKDVDNG